MNSRVQSSSRMQNGSRRICRTFCILWNYFYATIFYLSFVRKIRISWLISALFSRIVCYNIIKWGFSDFLPTNTFLDGLIRSSLFYYQAKLFMCPDMMRQNLFGIALQLIYLAIQYFYLLNKAPFHRTLIKTIILLTLILSYIQWESPFIVPIRFGYILTAFNLSTLYYPVCGIIQVITLKTTYGIPYTIIFFGQIVTTLWLLFAISINNITFIMQMLLSFILGLIQIILYFIYPSKPAFIGNMEQIHSGYAQDQIQPPPILKNVKKFKNRKTKLEEMRKRRLTQENTFD